MKNILYRMLPICLFTISLTGCEDETKYRPLPEAVPLTMSINEKAFVMGENLKVNINVDADADGNEMVANEDFDIYFTAKLKMYRMYLNHLAVLLRFQKEKNKFRWIFQ